jgi:hypothetical protein
MADSLDELMRRRDYECRLVPDRALDSLAEAAAFLRDRGLLTRTPDSSLPSLYEACHEDPYRPGVPGFGSWPATKWPWAAELAERSDVLALKVHNSKTILFANDSLPLIDPICRSELARMQNEDAGWRRILSHLADAGPSMVEDVQTELGLKPKQMKTLRYPLERCGALISRQVVLPAAGGGHVHAAELARWDQMFPEPTRGPGGMAELLAASIRAAVVAPEKELIRWFSWRWLFTADLLDSLQAAGRLIRPAPGWVAAPDGA